MIYLIIYLLSCILMWKYTHLSYSENGIYSGLKVLPVDFFLCFIPVVNTAANFLWIVAYPKKNKSFINYNKFFRIK
jgi:hypothetical protein